MSDDAVLEAGNLSSSQKVFPEAWIQSQICVIDKILIESRANRPNRSQSKNLQKPAIQKIAQQLPSQAAIASKWYISIVLTPVLVHCSSKSAAGIKVLDV